MRIATRLFLATSTALALVTTAHADVAPDPVVSTGIIAVAIGVVALVAVGVVFIIRYLRKR